MNRRTLLSFLAAGAAPAAGASLDARARAALEQGAAERDAADRLETAAALSLIAARDPAAGLLTALAADKDHLVRAAALTAIGELGYLRFAKAARDALDDEVPEVSFAAALALYRLKQPEGRALLVDVVEKEAKAKSGFLRSKLRDTWRRMKTPKSALFFAVETGARFVPVPGVGQGVSALSGMLSDPDFSARATSLVLLGSDRGADVRALIEQAFSDEEWSMRAAAVQIAAMRRVAAWRPRIAPLVEDSSRKVRYRAAAAYLRLGRAG
ncbi:MAG: HEAT repeat domain-containing protein [Variibacter sp.]|nr:HEAT repeat domain-containing protein [Variibacter sp.]